MRSNIGETPPTSKLFPRLPYDVQEQVIKAFFSQDEWADRHTLAKCASVCTDWHYLAAPILYGRIEVTEKKTYLLLKRTLEKSNLASRVEILSLVDSTPSECVSHSALHSLPRSLKGLKEILVFGPHGPSGTLFHYHPTLSATLSQLHSVNHIYLHRIEMDSLHELRKVLSALPSLDSAIFRSVSWRKTDSSQCSKRLLNATTWRLSMFSLSGCTSDFVAPIFWMKPPENTSQSSRDRARTKGTGLHPPIFEADVAPIGELAKFVLSSPERIVGSICWEWKCGDVSTIGKCSGICILQN